jgi:hypothetical protein
MAFSTWTRDLVEGSWKWKFQQFVGAAFRQAKQYDEAVKAFEKAGESYRKLDSLVLDSLDVQEDRD